jgi:hypothetical protein
MHNVYDCGPQWSGVARCQCAECVYKCEKVYTTAGLEFRSNAGRPAIIVRALYGLKSSGARWRDHLASILRQEGFKSSLADADVWLRKARKPCGFIY